MRARPGDAVLASTQLCSAAPDAVSADAGLSISGTGEPQFGVSACFIGPIEDGKRALARALEPLKARVAPNEETMEAARYLDIQSAGDATFPRGHRYYWKAQFLGEIGEAAAEPLLDGPLGALRTASAAGCLQRRERHGLISVPSRDDAFWTLLLHDLFDRRSIPREHRERLSHLAAVTPPGGTRPVW